MQLKVHYSTLYYSLLFVSMYFLKMDIAQFNRYQTGLINVLISPTIQCTSDHKFKTLSQPYRDSSSNRSVIYQ